MIDRTCGAKGMDVVEAVLHSKVKLGKNWGSISN